MNNNHSNANGFSVVILIIGVVLVLVFLVPIIRNNIEYNKFKNEIERVAQVSGVQALSVSCGNVELANICSVDYDIPPSKAVFMLASAGYSMESSSAGKVSGKNQSASIRVDSELQLVEGRSMTPNFTTTTIKYKDINTTL